MQICWSRYTQYIVLSCLESCAGFQEERWAIYRELIKRGHKIRILTPLTIPSEKLLHGVQAGTIKEEGGLDVTWMKQIEYDPTGFCNKEDDVLVVECGPPNFLFDDKYTGGLQIRRCAEICGTHKGLLIFSQNDPELPMSLWKMGMAKYPWSHKKNMYRIETKDNTYDEGKYNLKNYKNKEPYGWGDFDEMFGNKTVVLATKSLVPEKVAENYNGSRDRYADLVKEGLLHVESLPTAYEPLYVKDMYFNEDPEYDILYTGYPRHREKEFVELFCGMSSKLEMGVTGPWNEKKQAILSEHIECIGQLKGFRSMPKISNMSRAILQLAVKRAKVYDWVTSRHLEAVFSGAVCFYDSGYGCMEKYLGSEFAVKNHADAEKKYKWIARMGPNSRYKIWRYQMEKCKKYTWEWYITKFEKLCKKYGVKVKPKKIENVLPKKVNISKPLSKLR